MNYILATHGNLVRFYVIERDKDPILSEQLDLSKVTSFPNKESAKHAAQAIGLKTWRYIKI